MRTKWIGSAKKGWFYNKQTDFLSYDEIYEMMSLPANDLCIAFSTPKVAFGKYVSRQFKDISEDLVRQRDFILRFKEGVKEDTARAAHLVAQYLKSAGLQHGCTFICVAPSKPNAYQIRFKEFMEEVSRLSGIINGYDLVKVISERKEVHAGGARNQKNYLISSSIKGRKVVLFDDVITTGNSFVSFGSEIEKLGGEVIQGVFLAEAMLP